MTREDWANGKEFCSKCGKPKAVICRCEVANFRNSDEGQGDDSCLYSDDE